MEIYTDFEKLAQVTYMALVAVSFKELKMNPWRQTFLVRCYTSGCKLNFKGWH